MTLRRKTPLRARKRPVEARTGLRRGKPLAKQGKARKRRQARYQAFLRSVDWLAQRARILARDGCCTLCRGTERLQAHHKRYGSPLAETPDDWIVTLCYACHMRVEADLRPWNRGRLG